MTVSVTSSMTWALVGLAGAAACASVQRPMPGEIPRGLTHLLQVHDANGDGRISRAEYSRSDGAFRRLDRTGDEFVDHADFAFTGRRLLGMRPLEARAARGRALVAWYLQADGDPREVTAGEVREALAAYDQDGDGRVGRREFEASALGRRGFGRAPALRQAGLLEPETTDPWERLLQGLDGDEDGFLREAEVAAFHRQQADLDPAAWVLDGVIAGLAREGELAPDFTLERADGAGTITLSDARGERPVALVFGSYT